MNTLSENEPVIKIWNDIDLSAQARDGPVDLRSYVQSDWKSYLDSMSRDGEWGDAVILIGMAHMLKRNIQVVTSSPQGKGANVCSCTVYDSNHKEMAIRLGHVWELHYKSLGKMFVCLFAWFVCL